jgi:ubiquitin C-terminal hydrolase
MSGFQFGHYICFIRNNNRWFQFDDQTITIVDEL